MYPISNAVKALFEAEENQVLRITGTDANGVAISITDANVMLDGFNIDRFSCNGNKLEIGTACASELTLKLDNRQGQYSGIVFEGAELFVEVGIGSPVNWIPCGYFTPDEQPRSLSTITIKALDRMTKLDVIQPYTPWTTQNGDVMTDSEGNILYFASYIGFPSTVEDIVKRVCLLCSIPFSQDLSGFPNYNYVVQSMPELEQEITMRNVIQWCAGIMGTNAWMDWNGELRFSWYDATTGYVMTTANRFNSDLYENAIAITGVKYVDDDEGNTVYLAGTNDYALDLSGNAFVNADNAGTILTGIYNVVHNYAYTPFTASVINAPYLWPMDRVSYTDKDGDGHVSLLTNVNFGINGATALKANGETAELNSTTPPHDFTTQQRKTLDRIQRVNSKALNDAVDHATQMITGGLGGYVILNVNEVTGQTEEILIMDTPDKETAVNVWRFNQGGLGHSSNGYDGPYNDVALTADGQINANMITVGEMVADRIMGGMLTLGGVNDVRGQLQVLDGEGNVVGTWNNAGLTMEKGRISLKINNGAGIVTIGSGNNAIYYSYTDSGGYNYRQQMYNDTLYLGNRTMSNYTYFRNNDINMWRNTDTTDAVIGTDIAINMNNEIAGKRLWIQSKTGIQLLEKSGSSWLSKTALGYTGISTSGSLSVSGTKNRRVETDQYSDRLLYCYETPTPMFGDIGEGTIGEDGLCYISLDAVFAQTVVTQQYQVFLQRYGEGECWVRERKGAYFIVQGTPGLAFGWEIKAKQRDYDQLRLERADEPFTVPEQSYGADAAQYINEIRKERIPA